MCEALTASTLLACLCVQMCVAWLREKGVPIPDITIEDLASGSSQTGLVLCKALHAYDMSCCKGEREGSGSGGGEGAWMSEGSMYIRTYAQTYIYLCLRLVLSC